MTTTSNGRTLRPPTPAFASLDAIPWAGASGIVDASAYAAFLSHERTMADADEWGMLDDRGRFVDFDGAEFGDWIDPLPLPTSGTAPRLVEDPDPSAAVGTLDAYLAVMDADRCATLTSEAPYG